MTDTILNREPTPGVSVDAEFLARWSPRAFEPTPLRPEELNTVLEAARWAPSCFNAQPWRFAYVHRDSLAWPDWLACLVDANRAWAQHGSALIAVISRSEYERNDKPAPTHSFDAGAAWMSLALQAAKLGLITHAMQGFDQSLVRNTLSVPEVYDIPALVAIGFPGQLEGLPKELRQREAPSSRKTLNEIVFENNFEEMQL
ncbi:MAG: nitroreductase family protein [Pseudomonadota bacterium]